MKKSTLFFMISFLMIAAITQAQNTLNNPKDKDGHYIVKWDCEKNAFADSNAIESDETFTFAVDITGTQWEEWVKDTPDSVGGTRSVAINKWTNFGDVSGGTNRLKLITGNIYGAKWNIIQMGTDPVVAKGTGIDSVIYIYGQVFGWEYTPTNPGATWYQIAAGIDPGAGTGAIFKTLPYTGTKTSEEFYSDEFGEESLFYSNNTPEQGYTLPCAEKVPTTLPDVIGTDAKVIGHEYYNVMGQRLPKEPLRGLFFDKMLKADGTYVVVKKINLREQ